MQIQSKSGKHMGHYTATKYELLLLATLNRHRSTFEKNCTKLLVRPSFRPVSPSVCPHRGSHWSDFHEI